MCERQKKPVHDEQRSLESSEKCHIRAISWDGLYWEAQFWRQAANQAGEETH